MTRSRSKSRVEPISCRAPAFRPDTRSLRIDGAEMFLPPAESRLLHALLPGQGAPQGRDALTRFARGHESTPGDRTVDVLIARLRKRIPANMARVVTVHRLGYALSQS